MNTSKRVMMLYGREGMELAVPTEADVLRGRHPAAVEKPGEAVRAGLEQPIGCGALRELVRAKRPRGGVAITISDITRPVPNKVILPELLKVLNEEGVGDGAVTIVVGTGMHRPSTPE
ncbi:MAG: lactate racemase domain-containing protein, partial [Phycisphaerales bacterium]|nr:lactate racemase domain-containing protein [Phycisphaerales bacterium]